MGIPLELVLLHKVSSWDQSFLQCGGLVTKGECSRNVKVEAPDLLNSIYGPYFLFFIAQWSKEVIGQVQTQEGKKQLPLSVGAVPQDYQPSSFY